MTPRSLRRCGRCFGVRLAPLPPGVEGLRLAAGLVLVRSAPRDTYARTVRRVLHVLAYYRRSTRAPDGAA